jgi:hypothetical protein
MKVLYPVLIVGILSACEANEFDAKIEIAKASILIEKEKAYARSIASANQPKELFSLMGEIKCSDAQVASGRCGVIVYNPNSRSVVPERDKNWVDGVEAVGNTLVGTLKAATPFLLAKEVTSIVGAVGANAGGNTTNTDSYNQANSTKTAGGELADAGSTIDRSVSSVATDESDNSSIASTDSNDNNSVVNTDDNSIVNNTDDNSINTNTDDNSVVTQEPAPEPEAAL